MNIPLRKVVLVARSFNDLDCRLPLLREFASIEGISTSVLIIPTTSSSGLRVTHPFLERMEIPCFYTINLHQKNWIRHVCAWISLNIEQSSAHILSHRVWSRLWRVIYYWITKSARIQSGVLQLTTNALVIIDDIVATPSRSFVVPLLVSSQSLKLICLSHGQNTFLNLWYDKPRKLKSNTGLSSTLTIFTPSDNDSRILESNYQNVKAITIGNTRFDRDWILFYQEKFLDGKSSLRPFSGTKIVFMMSKMEYGLEARAVIRIINQASARRETRIILKPHTRGMSVDEFSRELDSRVIIADKILSSELINWADIVFFTSSSIVFEAIVKKKKILYLASLQRYKTIFDQLPSSAIFKDGDDLSAAIDRLEREQYEEPAMRAFLATNVHNGFIDGKVCAKFVTQILSFNDY